MKRKMLDFNPFTTCFCLMVTIKVVVLLSPTTCTTTQDFTNLNSTGKFSRIQSSNLTRLDNPTDSNFPKGPQNVQIKHIKNSQYNVSWKVDQESLESLEGFALEILCNYGLSKANGTENYTLIPQHNNKQTDFDMVLDLGYGSSNIILKSLPFKNDCYSTVRKTVIMSIRNNTNDIAPNWNSPIFINQEKNVLEVNFRRSPANEFNVCLRGAKNDCLTIREPSVKFQNIVPGNYEVEVTPTDCNNGSNCMVVASYIPYEEELCDKNIKEYLYPLLGGLAIGVLVLLILFVLVRLFGLKRHNLKKKSILLLNTNDNKVHEKAVENFIGCLENMNIVIIRPTFTLNKEPLKWLLNTVDHVLLLDSLALGKRGKAWAVNQDYVPFLHEPNSKELTKLLFSVINLSVDPEQKCHFLRCKWNFVPEDLEFKNYPSESRSFVLPDEFELLAKTIHQSGIDPRDCKFSMLKQSIHEESNFIALNPDWFEEKYGSPIEDTKIKISDKPSPQVLNPSDLISHVSSLLNKINHNTDREVDVNMVSLNGFDIASL